MTPYERLMAEAIPTGTFGGPRPNTPAHGPYEVRNPVSPTQAAQHYAELDTATNGWHWTDNPRHLHAVPNPESDAA